MTFRRAFTTQGTERVPAQSHSLKDALLPGTEKELTSVGMISHSITLFSGAPLTLIIRSSDVISIAEDCYSISVTLEPGTPLRCILGTDSDTTQT